MKPAKKGWVVIGIFEEDSREEARRIRDYVKMIPCKKGRKIIIMEKIPPTLAENGKA